jgi:phosphoglycolate phosphatase-like HAD superfamily hydrolase
MRAIIFDLDHTVFAADNVLHDGVRELLVILRRLDIAVGGLSGSDHRTLVRLDEAGVRGYFDQVLCADQAFEPKETPGVYHLLQGLGAQPHESVLVSHAHGDILLGKAAGLQRTIGVSHGSEQAAPLHEAGADHIVPNIPAVLDVLE